MATRKRLRESGLRVVSHNENPVPSTKRLVVATGDSFGFNWLDDDTTAGVGGMSAKSDGSGIIHLK